MANKKNFYIPKIDDNDRNTAYNRNKSSNSPFEKFASSYSGYNVEDKNVFPYVKYNNNGSQYEDLKDKKYQKNMKIIKHLQEMLKISIPQIVYLHI